MAEKYYNLSPYNYCAGNPVRYVDPNGKKIIFAKGSTDEFKTKFAEAVEYMNKCGTSYNIAALGKSVIAQGKYNNYNANTRTIVWNPNAVSRDQDTGLLRSPVTSLAHEAGHASNHDLKRGHILNEFKLQILRHCKYVPALTFSRGADTTTLNIRPIIYITVPAPLTNRRAGTIYGGSAPGQEHPAPEGHGRLCKRWPPGQKRSP